jgi:hypothetical protein
MHNISLLEITLFPEKVEDGKKKSQKGWVLVSHEISDTSYHIKIIPMFSYETDPYIIFPYEAIKDNDGQANKLSVEYSNGKLNFKNMIIVSPEFLRGHDLASYCMREIILWAKEKFSSDTIIEGLTLHDLGAESPENLLRRNSFYIRHGFVVKDGQGILKDNDLNIERGTVKGTVGGMLIVELRGEHIKKIDNQFRDGLCELPKVFANRANEMFSEILRLNRIVENRYKREEKLTLIKSKIFRNRWCAVGIGIFIGFILGLYIKG